MSGMGRFRAPVVPVTLEGRVVRLEPLARRHFAYGRLAERAGDEIDAALAARRPRPAVPSAVLTQP